ACPVARSRRTACRNAVCVGEGSPQRAPRLHPAAARVRRRRRARAVARRCRRRVALRAFPDTQRERIRGSGDGAGRGARRGVPAGAARQRRAYGAIAPFVQQAARTLRVEPVRDRTLAVHEPTRGDRLSRRILVVTAQRSWCGAGCTCHAELSSAATDPLPDVLTSPDFLPLRIDPNRRVMTFVRMSLDAYRDSVFLDGRTRRVTSDAYELRLDDLLFADANRSIDSATAHYVLHNTFFLSTLLARYFELLPSWFVLKE